MDMYDGKVVLCGANSYEEKYYLNPDFEQLPEAVKNEMKIIGRHVRSDPLKGHKKTERVFCLDDTVAVWFIMVETLF